MNEVRARVKVNLPGKSSTGEAWFKDYRNERKVELAYEGHLFWDMRRWELAHIEYNNYRTQALKSLVLPIHTNMLIATDRTASL